MTLTISPSSSLRFASSHKTEDNHTNTSSPQVSAGNALNSANHTDNIELTAISQDKIRNATEESARARQNFNKIVQRQASARHFSVPSSMENMLSTDSPKQLKEFILPITCNPHSSSHDYLQSSNPEFNKALSVLNKRIQRDPQLKVGLGNHPSNFTMEIFGNPSDTVETIYNSLRETYGDGLLVRTNQALEYGVDGFQEKEKYNLSWFGKELQKNEADKLKSLHKVKANNSPALKLNTLLGQEFSFPTGDSVAPDLQNFLRQHLGFAENQINYADSQIRKDHPEDQKLIRDWRLKTAARYVENRATHIQTTWGEWIKSVQISTLYSLGVETLLGNTITSIGPGAIFRSNLSALKKTGAKVPAWWRRLLLGLPEPLYNNFIGSAGAGKKVGVVVNGILAQGTAEAPDVALVKTGYKRVEDPSLTQKQALKVVLNEEKGSLAKSVLSASIGTIPEKMKELLWRPTSLGGKIGNWMTGYFTNGLSVLCCAYPFFEDGGPQRNQLGLSNAEAFYPETGDLKLMDKQRAALDKAIDEAKEGFEGVKRTFRGGVVADVVTDSKNLFKSVFEKGNLSEGAFSKFLHKLPTSKLLAASIPVAVGYSLIPSTINGACKTFLAEGVVSEAIQGIISLVQVPLFGPIELLAFNTVAVLNRNHPNFVTGLSKIGRPVLDGVFGVAKGIKGGIGSAWRTFRRAPKPEDPNQVYKNFYNAYKKIHTA